MEKCLMAGYGRECITPDFPVTLSGYGNDAQRPAMGVEHDIYVTCIAVNNGEKTLLIYTMDSLAASEFLANDLRAEMKKVCDIPSEQIYLAAIHSHSCPRTAPGLGGEKYRAFFLEKAVIAGQAALADLAPAKMELAKGEAPEMAYVRHYEMADGTYAGINYGDLKHCPIAGYAAECDNTLVLLRFVRENKTDILLMNFQAHPALSYQIGRHMISPCWVGRMRDRMEEKTGLLIAYYNGASGNQITRTFLKPGEERKWYEFGWELADHALALMETLSPIEGTEINNTHFLFEAKSNHAWDHMLKEANEVYDLWQTHGADAADQLARSYGFSSRYQTWQIRASVNRPESEIREMNAFRIGPVGFTTGTYEMSSTEGIYVRKNSPFDTTILLCGNSGYIPTSKAYDMRTYEGDTSPFVRGTAEKMAETYVEMLKKVQ